MPPREAGIGAVRTHNRQNPETRGLNPALIQGSNVITDPAYGQRRDFLSVSLKLFNRFDGLHENP